MALDFGSHGLSITSETSPLAPSVIQGGDLLNLTFHLDYNGTNDVLLDNSTACRELNNRTVFINFVITLPIVFDIIYTTNMSNHTGSILTDFLNCSVMPSLQINSAVFRNDIQGFHVLKFDILSQNVTWAVTLDVQLRLQHSAKTDSLLDITANAAIANETKQLNIPSYRTPIPGNIQLAATSTSIPETPNVVLTSEEDITLSASFQLPRITANLELLITLPTFRNSTPMRYLRGSVKSLSQGIVSQNLGVDSSAQFSISPSNLHRFPNYNVAKFVFGETVNTANEPVNGIIAVEVTGVVDSTQGVYASDSEGNVTCLLMYYSSSGFPIVADETLFTLNLGQPSLERYFFTQGSECCYEGNNVVELKFEARNPHTATAPALNVTIDITVFSSDIAVHNILVELCENNLFPNQSSSVICTDLMGTDMLTNSSSGLTVNLPRLNSSAWVHGSLFTLVKPSVAAKSFHSNRLSLVYTRTDWSPISADDIQSIMIKSVSSFPPFVVSSNVPHPSRDLSVITIGEDMVFRMTLSLPVSTNDNFIVQVSGEGAEGIGGRITRVGSNIHALRGQFSGSVLNVTSNSKVFANFGTIVNTGNSSQPLDSEIEYEATVRATNDGAVTNGKTLDVVFDVIVNGINQPSYAQSLQVIEPDLTVSVNASRSSGVQPNDDITYTVQLRHSEESASHAYRVLLEIAVPHEYLSHAQITESPSGGGLTLVDGNQAASGNLRYNNPSTKVLLYQADDLLLGQTVSFKYKASTVSNLQPSIFVSSPVHLAYVTLPKSLAPHEGRKYTHDEDQATFLTFRPAAFVSVTFDVTDTTGSFDAGDRVEYSLALKNIAPSTTAHELTMVATFESLDTNRTYVTCSAGSPTYNASLRESKLFISSIAPSQTAYCNFTSFLQDRISPKQLISQTVEIEYYSFAVANSPQNYASYKERIHANLTTKTINTTILASQNAEKLQAGDPVNFTLHLQLPECITNLSVGFNLPTVPRSVIDLSRRRRDITGSRVGRASGEAGRRSRVKRSAGLVYVLTPLLNESYVKYGNGITLFQLPAIMQVNADSLNVVFGLIENLPGSGPNDTVEIFLKFTIANNPLVLSGRPFHLIAVFNFDAGSGSSTKTFIIVGPLLKPLLSINKTVEVQQQEGDSPPVAFNVTIGHASGSLYDARNLTVTDTAQGMDIYDSDITTKGVVIRYPEKNTFGVHFTLPSLQIGETRSFIYVARFKVAEKQPSTLRIPAEVAWKSLQLNSPTYRLTSDASTACLQRNDVNEAEPRKVFGYFALGVILGLLIGAVIAAILVLLVIKCCDKGKMAPHYMRFTNTTTMTVLTGGSQYIYQGQGGELPDNSPIEKHAESSIVQTDESIVPILTLENATQTEKELNSLDVQSTAALDADLETQRQNMFVKAVKLLARKLRVKREISSQQESNFCLEIKQAIGAVAFKMAAEYKRKSAELRKKLRTEGKNRLDALHRNQRSEREETENKIKGLVNEREKKNILEILKRRQEAQEQELKQNLKLEQDVEMEKLRKEVSISKRFALKEAQNKLIQNLIKDAKLNEEQANAIITDHLANMAAVDKATDEERARRVMELEMRLTERRALARQKQEEQERKKKDLTKLEENHSDALENLVRSSTLSSEDAALYLERFRKEMEVVDNKLAKDRKRQEQKLHQKLTALKQKKIEEKAREHQRQIKEFEGQQDGKFERVEIDTVTAINDKQKLLEQQRQEIEDIERNSDREAAEEIENLRDQQTRDANQLIKNNAQKMYQELVNKGLSESEKEAILERQMADVAMQQEAREEERRRQREILERRLEKQRAVLEKKRKEEQAEQAEIRKQEDKIVGDLIVNQVVMSEDERDRIIQEHEKNLAELESSLTLSKLRQRQLLEEKLAQRRKRRMEQLEQRQMEETKDRDYDDKILAEGEDIEMIKKHEHEKMAAMREDEIHIADEMETVREEMLAERSKKLEEHHEKLGEIIAQLQIEKAKQISKITMQQEALGQLQVGLIDELESKGTFEDPETKKIMEKYQKDTKSLEENLKLQKDKQEKALRGRLQERMRQREESLVLQQKDELSRYLSNINASNVVMKFRKAAVKGRHQKELDDLRNRIQKEIDQSINELKMASDIRRMQAVEAQNIKLISILVKKGKLQEEELEGVLAFLFPTKSSNEIDEFLSKIYGPDHNKGSGQAFLDPRKPSTLEARIRRNSSVHTTTPPIRKPSKKKKKSKKNEEEQTKDLPPITFKGGKKGFNLNESLRGYRSLADEEQNATRSEPRGDEDQRDLPNVSRNGSYQPLAEENSEELVDEMFGDSPEKSKKLPAIKRRRRRIRDEGHAVS